MLCLILGLAFLYRSQLLPPKSGSAPGAPSISLEKMIIVSQPSQPPLPQLQKPVIAPSAPAPAVVTATPPRESEARPVPPEATVPVLAVQPSTPVQKTAPKTRVTMHPASSPTATAHGLSKPAAATSVSSYAPGVSVFPHPPYPPEAVTHRETGVVLMNVQFDAKGNVARAEVEQSSGVLLLDTETRSFIRMHWHSTEYAGQIISQSVQYSF